MLISGLVLTLYFWVFFAGIGDVSGALLVSDLAAILAGAAFVLGFISYLWVPKNHISIVAFINYLILTAVVATLVADTGYLASPFIALWILISVFAPLFNWLGVLSTMSIVAIYIVHLIISSELATADILALMLVAILPIVVGLIIQSQLSKTVGSNGEGAYSRLVSKLGSVEGKSEVVIAAIADGVVALNGDGVVELINPAAQAMIGWGRDDALNLDYKSVIKLYNSRDKPPEAANDPIYQALQTNETTHSETMSISTSDGNKKFLSAITASPVDVEGSGVIVVFRDITREKAEEREQAEFISTASHEMRTPVASIEGYLGLALNPSIAQVDEKARDYITKAQASAHHLGRLFQDLLDVSRVDDNRLNITPRVIDVVQLVHDIAGGLLSQAEQKGLRLVFKPQPDLHGNTPKAATERTLTPIYYTEVDSDHLREVVANLIENAIKYTSQGSINIDVTGDGSHVTIDVTDSGVGIPKNDIPHLFQKFYRVDDTDTREAGGTGLGLYLARKLVESMHGKIWVDSTYQQGSTFFVQLPRLENIAAKEKLATQQTEAHKDAEPEASSPLSPQDSASLSTVEQPPLETIPPDTATTPLPPPTPASRSQATSKITDRPSIADMSPRPANQQPPRPLTVGGRRQNIPLDALEEHSDHYIRQDNDTPPPSQ